MSRLSGRLSRVESATDRRRAALAVPRIRAFIAGLDPAESRDHAALQHLLARVRRGIRILEGRELS